LTSPLDRIRVVLCATSHPGNIGAAARAMRAMGLSRLVLVAPRQFPDADADARAAGAVALLRAASVVSTLDAALAGAAMAIGFSARPREFAGAALPVRTAAREAVRHAADREVAVVFGSEWDCRTTSLRAVSRGTIPGEPGQASPNLAAVQVAARLFLAAREACKMSPRSRRPRSTKSRSCLHTPRHSDRDALPQPQQPKRLPAAARRLFARDWRGKSQYLRGILARIDQLDRRS
jgi:tRNA/rRNA methyltransferase